MKRRLRDLTRTLLRLVEGDEGYDRLAKIPFEDCGFGYDVFGFERESLYAAYLALKGLYRSWFRVESHGHENVPATGPAILAGNHSGLLPWDGAMIGIDLLARLEPPRPVRAIVEYSAFGLPFVGVSFMRAGAVAGTKRNFEELLRHGNLVLVFPEGAKGIGKPWRERYRLKPFNVGFVEIAIANRAPIVPFAVIGAEEQARVLFRSRRLGKLVGMPFLPVTPTFPLLGPLGLLPSPSKHVIYYGEPIHFHREHPPEAAREPELIAELARKVQDRVQAMVSSGLKLRDEPAAKRGEPTRTSEPSSWDERERASGRPSSDQSPDRPTSRPRAPARAAGDDGNGDEDDDGPGGVEPR